jgi:hypothetical protein
MVRDLTVPEGLFEGVIMQKKSLSIVALIVVLIVLGINAVQVAHGQGRTENNPNGYPPLLEITCVKTGILYPKIYHKFPWWRVTIHYRAGYFKTPGEVDPGYDLRAGVLHNRYYFQIMSGTRRPFEWFGQQAEMVWIEGDREFNVKGHRGKEIRIIEPHYPVLKVIATCVLGQ